MLKFATKIVVKNWQKLVHIIYLTNVNLYVVSVHQNIFNLQK